MTNDFPTNLTKGKIAETIFWLMFRDTYFTILPFGWEQIIAPIAQYHGGSGNYTSNVKKMSENPDYVLIAPDKSIYTIDVKYCQSLTRNRLRSKAEKTIKEWPDCYYFVATPDGFFVDKCKEIAEGKDNLDPLSSVLIPENIQNYYTDLLNEFIRVEKNTSENYPNFEDSLLEEQLPDKRSKANPFERAGKPWSKEEDNLLMDEYDRGTEKKDIARKHKRSYGSIQSRLVKLGKIQITTF